MANLPPLASVDTPETNDIRFGVVRSTGTINPNDLLIFSGHFAIPTAMAAANAVAVKASAAGIAMEANPVYDSFGNAKQNTAMVVMRQGYMRVSAQFNASASADITLGHAVYPATTGSGVNAPTGLTGVGSQWMTAAKPAISANPTGAPSLGIGVLAGINRFGTGSGTTQIDIYVPNLLRTDYL